MLLLCQAQTRSSELWTFQGALRVDKQAVETYSRQTTGDRC